MKGKEMAYFWDLISLEIESSKGTVRPSLLSIIHEHVFLIFC